MTAASRATELQVHTITADNIGKESFHNLCRLAEFTGYANPLGALQALPAGTEWEVIKDGLGNILDQGDKPVVRIDLNLRNADGVIIGTITTVFQVSGRAAAEAHAGAAEANEDCTTEILFF